MGIFVISNSHFDGLVEEKCNSIVDALELHFSCINPLIYGLP